MIKNIQRFCILLSFIGYCYMPYSVAIFLSVQDFVDPETGNHVWIMGDVHCDIDARGTLARLQQHIVLEEAEKRHALIIAESANISGYNPYFWMGILSMDALLLCKLIKDKRYLFAGLSVAWLASHGTLWFQEWQKTKKPIIDFEKYIESIKSQPPFARLTCFNYTPLLRLVEEATLRGIPAIDVEFRYHFVGAYNRPLPELSL